jgi:hypothetical protein
MTIIRKIEIRPTVDIEFFVPNEEFTAIVNQFTNDGKILNVDTTLSEDQLTRTKVITFKGDETFLMWRHHPEVRSYIAKYKKHNFENSIITDTDFI